jgi:hypothetical protein
MKEASDLRDVLQVHDSSTNPGWNDYLDWDLPGLTYQPDALAWYPNDVMDITGQPFFTDAHSPTTSAANGLPDADYEGGSNTEFCGLQPWYPNATGTLSSEFAAASTRPQPSTSTGTSYNSTSLDEGIQPADQKNSNKQLSPKISHRRPSLDGISSRRVPRAQAADLVQNLEESHSPSSEEENERVSTAKSEAHKKRKLAHSVIEKNYRSRIKDGMAELRNCVPSREKGRRSLDSGGYPVTGDSASSASSGKVATLSDAVQYVRALERQNEALHGQLDVMQRRNNTLQKIALSKVDTTVSVEEIDEENVEEQIEGGQSEQANKRSTKLRVRRRDEARLKVVAHAPNLRRHGGVSGTLPGTFADIPIS